MGIDTLADASRTLRAAYAGLPTPEEMDALIADSYAAEARGYYDPQEDERLRENYARYLGIRTAIWQMIGTLRPKFKTFKSAKSSLSTDQLRAFGVAFCGAEIIVGTGQYLIRLARKRDIVWRKLDEAELHYGLKRKSFTRLYRQLTSVFKMRGFYEARYYFNENQEAILAALESETLKPVAKILIHLQLRTASRDDHLKRYRRFVHFSLRRRRLSTGHKTMFMLFEATGSDIAELKIPLVKQPGAAKRVSAETLKRLKPQLQPGDVFITRHDDAMSNLFLPGFWPHGALYIGLPEARSAMGVNDVSDGYKHYQDDLDVLEAKKDGVLLRALEETLHVDAFVVLRPKLSSAEIAKALNRGLTHAGKLYDFVFDFATSNRLVCTEVIYRAYHGVGPIDFKLSTKAGRKCLSAEDLINQAISNDWFELVLIYGVQGNEFYEGSHARRTLSESFKSNF